ncbi:11361_t:CDS:2 [Cetraspora pellucida]|uniref:11361_t:CDS:1 n=1 Tax=Cetraspora pellucida TaxID=1433469 RepID=A0ACA9KBV2_9GLOM|nr:11361_t:CDS:2 [Cetraspora pellucida]
MQKKQTNNYLLNTKQSGEALELLKSLATNSADLVFLDPQYEKGLLGSDRIAAWMIKAPNLRIVDCLVWYKKNTLGLEENSLPTKQRRHPHQKPKELIKTLIAATTEEGDLVVDPCAGSFIVLEVCQELGRDYLGVDLTYREVRETRKTATKELLKEESQNLNFYPAPGVRYPRKSLRILQFATKVSLDFDSQVREIANKEGIYIAEVLERCLAAYLYCKDKGINVDDY